MVDLRTDGIEKRDALSAGEQFIDEDGRLCTVVEVDRDKLGNMIRISWTTEPPKGA